MADIDERQHLSSRHPVRWSLHRALEHLAVDDHHLTAQVLTTADAEVARRPDVIDGDAGLIRSREQRVQHRELGHRTG